MRSTAPRTERQARERETAALERLAKRLEKTAQLVRLAATYHEDGAFDTARVRMRNAREELANHIRYIANDGWHDKQWRADTHQRVSIAPQSAE